MHHIHQKCGLRYYISALEPFYQWFQQLNLRPYNDIWARTENNYPIKYSITFCSLALDAQVATINMDTDSQIAINNIIWNYWLENQEGYQKIRMMSMMVEEIGSGNSITIYSIGI